MRPAVNMSRHQKPVPMYGRVKVKRILDRHLHLIAAAQADDRSKDWSRVAIGPCRLALEEGVPSGPDFQFYPASLFCRFDQPSARQARVSAHRRALLDVSTDE